MDLQFNKDLSGCPAEIDVMTYVSISGDHMLRSILCPQLAHFLGTDTKQLFTSGPPDGCNVYHCVALQSDLLIRRAQKLSLEQHWVVTTTIKR